MECFLRSAFSSSLFLENVPGISIINYWWFLVKRDLRLPWEKKIIHWKLFRLAWKHLNKCCQNTIWRLKYRMTAKLNNWYQNFELLLGIDVIMRFWHHFILHNIDTSACHFANITASSLLLSQVSLTFCVEVFAYHYLEMDYTLKSKNRITCRHWAKATSKSQNH